MVNWDSALEEERKKHEEQKQQEVESSEKETKQKEMEGLDTSEKRKKLILEARGILGETLAWKFKERVEQYPNLNSFYKNFAPYLLRFSRNPNGNFRANFVESIGRDFFSDACSDIAEGYIGQTDLLDPVSRGGPKSKTELKSSDFESLFSEYRAIAKVISDNINLGSFYDVVMFMEPQNRPLITIATKRFLDNSPVPQGQTVSLISRYPDLETVLRTAKDYGITELRGIITEFNKYSNL